MTVLCFADTWSPKTRCLSHFNNIKRAVKARPAIVFHILTVSQWTTGDYTSIGMDSNQVIQWMKRSANSRTILQASIENRRWNWNYRRSSSCVVNKVMYFNSIILIHLESQPIISIMSCCNLSLWLVIHLWLVHI